MHNRNNKQTNCIHCDEIDRESRYVVYITEPSPPTYLKAVKGNKLIEKLNGQRSWKYMITWSVSLKDL